MQANELTPGTKLRHRLHADLPPAIVLDADQTTGLIGLNAIDPYTGRITYDRIQGSQLHHDYAIIDEPVWQILILAVGADQPEAVYTYAGDRTFHRRARDHARDAEARGCIVWVYEMEDTPNHGLLRAGQGMALKAYLARLDANLAYQKHSDEQHAVKELAAA